MIYIINNKTDMPELAKQVASDTGLATKLDSAVVLPQKFIVLLQGGVKKHTIKFHQEDGKDVVRLPESPSLPLIGSTAGNAEVGRMFFDFVDVKKYGLITELEGAQDGFISLEEFRQETEELARARGFDLSLDSITSRYHIEKIVWK